MRKGISAFCFFFVMITLLGIGGVRKNSTTLPHFDRFYGQWEGMKGRIGSINHSIRREKIERFSGEISLRDFLSDIAIDNCPECVDFPESDPTAPPTEDPPPDDTPDPQPDPTPDPTGDLGGTIDVLSDINIDTQTEIVFREQVQYLTSTTEESE